MGPTKTAKLGETGLMSNQKVNVGLIVDEPKHDQETTEAGMKEELEGG